MDTNFDGTRKDILYFFYRVKIALLKTNKIK